MRIGLLLLGVVLLGCSGPSPEATTRGATRARAHVDRPPGTARLDRRGVDQVWVPAGTFTMGTADTTGLNPPSWAVRELPTEMPAHPVRITRGYWIDRFEVTVAAYQAFIDGGGYENDRHWSEEGWAWRQAQSDLPAICGEDPEHPVTCVSWYEAEAYANWRGGRLPTDAEWEYAARGPESRIYPWGDTWDASRANVEESSGTTAVGFYPGGVSWVGAHDMAGNAMEWVSDWLSVDYYLDTEMVDPKGPETGTRKIEKGGWWGSNPFVARSAYHHFEDPPEYRDHHIGFRVVTEER